MKGLSWIIRVNPKCNYYCHYKRKAEEELTETEKARQCDRRQMERCGHKPRNAGSYQKLKEARNGFSPSACAAKDTTKTLIFDLAIVFGFWSPEL